MNILWILEDALRPRHMGCYGYERNTTPNCDELARNGVRFDACIATASHTLPPIVSMLTGQDTAQHGIVNCRRFAQWKFEGLWHGRKTPVHALRDAGFLVDGELVLRWEPLGFDQETPGNEIEQFMTQHRDRDWFFFAEPYPTHLPYDPPPDYLDMFFPDDYRPTADTLKRMQVVRSFLIVHPSGQVSKLEAGEDDPLPDDDTDDAHKRTAGAVDLRPEDRPFVHALYDGEVRRFDDLVGTWVRKLKQLGLFDDTLIIITADHGEELMERGHVGHSSCNLNGTLYDESIHVPLIMHWPNRLPAGAIVPNQVSHIDLMPTVFDLLGLAPIATADGVSMLPLITGETAPFRTACFAETTPAGWQALAADDREVWCVRTDRWKLILHTDERDRRVDYELYDLEHDPGETRSVYTSDHPAGSVLRQKLTAYVARARQNRC